MRWPEFNAIGKAFANAGFAALSLANCGAGAAVPIPRRCLCHPLNSGACSA
jgi:hypothetical protein